MKRKDVLTTGQVAEICSVAPRTVTKWFDSGQLKGYRIPGSKDRRIPTAELIRFMRAHEMPTDALEMGIMRVLLIDSNWETGKNLAETISQKGCYEVEIAQNSFDAGLIVQKMLPHVIFVSLMSPDIDAAHLCTYIRSHDELQGTRIIAIAEGIGDSEKMALQQKGFDDVLQSTTDGQRAIEIIEEVTAIVY
jgi:excisionase family DNA binding protein